MTKPRAVKHWPVWDWPVRLTHWFFVVAVIAMWWTGEEGLFEWHSKLGYVILTLVVSRLIWGFVGSYHARFVHFVRGWKAVAGYVKEPIETVGHNPLGALSVLALLGVGSRQTPAAAAAAAAATPVRAQSRKRTRRKTQRMLRKMSCRMRPPAWKMNLFRRKAC